jgi:effector-binding domain-containing protein
VDYDVRLSVALPRPLAAVRRSVKRSAIPSLIQGVLGEVWQFLRDNQIRSSGHNVAIYALVSDVSAVQEGVDSTLDAWFGVEVHETIPASENVLAISTPDGPVASTIHWGQYSGLGAAHTAVRHWCATHGQRLTGRCWEVYGDWFDDWAKVRTDVFYELTELPHPSS